MDVSLQQCVFPPGFTYKRPGKSLKVNFLNRVFADVGWCENLYHLHSSVQVEVAGEKFELRLWDTAGQEAYEELRKQVFWELLEVREGVKNFLPNLQKKSSINFFPQQTVQWDPAP